MSTATMAEPETKIETPTPKEQIKRLTRRYFDDMTKSNAEGSIRGPASRTFRATERELYDAISDYMPTLSESKRDSGLVVGNWLYSAINGRVVAEFIVRLD